MKGRVLVALADGTLAIFHRGEGKFDSLGNVDCFSVKLEKDYLSGFEKSLLAWVNKTSLLIHVVHGFTSVGTT